MQSKYPNKKPIYFDYAATTPVDLSVAEKMQHYLTLESNFGNPASNTHIYGLKASEAVEHARAQIASLINASPEEIIWTSGATESDNLAIKGAAYAYQHRGKHIITSKIEHKAVLDTCKYLESKGFTVTYLQPEKTGIVNPATLKSAIRSDTILVSLMYVNNELGAINDIAVIGDICRKHDIIYHTDAAQAVGKIPIDLANLPIDLMSFSGHKIYGPKGIGALFVCQKPKVQLAAQIHGGGHEKGMRSGTLATHQIVGMGAAFELAGKLMLAERKKLTQFKQYLWTQLSQLPDVFLNGSLKDAVPGILNVSVGGVEGIALLWAVSDLAISMGSACSSAAIAPSFVLSALGVPDHLAHASLRISFGRFTSKQDIEFAAEHLCAGIKLLRSIAPAEK